MKSDVIQIWRFEDAPESLRRPLEASQAAWLALIPKAVWSRELEDLILERTESEGLTQYERPNGDIVYAGLQAAAVLV